METIEELLANNRRFAEPLADRHLEVEPSRRLAIVTCMDSRLDVFAALGLGDGEAHVLRNAGGVVSDDVIRSLAISQRRLGTREVMLIHHTDCGLEKLTDEGFRVELEEATGSSPSSRSRPSSASRRASASRSPASAARPSSPIARRFAVSSTTSTPTACARSSDPARSGPGQLPMARAITTRWISFVPS
jgi:carbonic anhydrase